MLKIQKMKWKCYKQNSVTSMKNTKIQTQRQSDGWTDKWTLSDGNRWIDRNRDKSWVKKAKKHKWISNKWMSEGWKEANCTKWVTLLKTLLLSKLCSFLLNQFDCEEFPITFINIYSDIQLAKLKKVKIDCKIKSVETILIFRQKKRGKFSQSQHIPKDLLSACYTNFEYHTFLLHLTTVSLFLIDCYLGSCPDSTQSQRE